MSSTDKPMVGILTLVSNNPASAARSFDKISFLMNDPNDLTVGSDVGKSASNRSEALKLKAEKSTEGDKSSANCSSGRKFFTSNISKDSGSMGIPEIEKSVKRSKLILLLRIPTRVASPILSSSNLSNVKDTANESEKDVAYPKATARCGRNISTIAQTTRNEVVSIQCESLLSIANLLPYLGSHL